LDVRPCFQCHACPTGRDRFEICCHGGMALALEVFRWQTKHGLLADGIVGQETLSHPDIVAVIDSTQPSRQTGMTVSAEQFVALVLDIRTRYRHTPYEWSNPEVIQELLYADYGVSQVLPPRFTYDDVCRECLPPLPAPPAWTRERIAAGEPNRIRNVSPGVARYMDQRVQEGRQWEPGPPSPYEGVADDLRLLRTSPIGAMAFVGAYARGADRREAMNWARLADQYFGLFVLSRRGVIAHSRAISGRSARPGNSDWVTATRPTTQIEQRGTRARLPIAARDYRSRSQRNSPRIPVSVERGSRRPLPPPRTNAQIRRELVNRVSREQARVRAHTAAQRTPQRY
jgi:hypothetical protein